MILRPILTNVSNISKHNENYNDDEDTKISIIIYREVMTCLNKLKDYLMASSIDT